MISFFAPGIPAPQGSKTYLGSGRMVESSKRVKPFRAVVTICAREAMGSTAPSSGPVDLTISFVFPRPKGHYGTGKNAERLKESAPLYPVSHSLGDIDKLCRAALDAMTGAVFLDDSQVVSIQASRHWGDNPGSHVVAKFL